MKRFFDIIPLMLCLTLFQTACTYEDEFAYSGNPHGLPTAEISFLAEAPATSSIALRSTGAASENSVNEVYVLVFDKTTETLLYKSKGKSLNIGSGAVNNNTYTFKATLPVGTEYTFMVLANAEDKLAGIEVGLSPAKSKSDVQALLVQNTGKWDLATQSIPMWDEQDLNLTSTDNPVFYLTRMMARINVDISLKEINGVNPDNFELTSVRLYHYNTVGQIIPDPDHFNSTTQTAIEPTIPVAPGTEFNTPQLYTGTDITNGQSCKGKIYLFEVDQNGFTYDNPGSQHNWVKNPCLVIGGKYTTPQGLQLEETFYRVDFIRKDATDPNNILETWIPVLRNFSYNFTIVQVNGSGFMDPDEALHSAPINMEAKILEWDEMEMGEIAFDGTFYLSVSKDEFTVGVGAETNETEANTFYVKTDYTYLNNPLDPKSGWKVEKYVDAGTDQEVTWLQLHPDAAAPDPENKVKVYFTYEENHTGAPRTALIWLAAGRLRYPVYVTQRISSLRIVDPLTGLDLDELEFEVPKNGSSRTTQSFEVRWTPVGQSVAIQEEQTHVWAGAFPPEWLNPNPNTTGWSITTGTGSQTYVVTAPAVDASLVEQDPFYERESIYSFTVDDGSGAETKSIKLHQIHYNLVGDTYAYKLDGNTYQLMVRSNAEWRISKIEEWLYNKDPSLYPESPPVMLQYKNGDNLVVGATGGPNVVGEILHFTVVNQAYIEHEKKWGTVYVTFESVDGKFNDVVVPLRFPARKLTFLGLGYALDVRAFNPAFSTPYHKQGLNRMLTAEVNFGNLEESTVKTQPFEIIGYNCQEYTRSGPGQTPDANWYVGSLRKWLNQHNPDIIFCAYSMRFSTEDARLLRRYLDQGGAVILYHGGDLQEKADLKRLMDPMLDINLTAETCFWGTPEGAVYVLENKDDPILNGPFRNVRGANFGTHIHHAGIKESLISDQVEVLCRMESMVSHTPGSERSGMVNVFRHKTKALFWVGNAMGTSSYYPDEIHRTYDMFRNDADFRPQPRLQFGGTGNTYFDIYNTYLCLNAIAWAMEQTRHVAPEGGY